MGTGSSILLDTACLAGLQQDIFHDIGQLKDLNVNRKQFSPSPDIYIVCAFYKGWKKAIKKTFIILSFPQKVFNKLLLESF